MSKNGIPVVVAQSLDGDKVAGAEQGASLYFQISCLEWKLPVTCGPLKNKATKIWLTLVRYIIWVSKLHICHRQTTMLFQP